MKTTLSFRSIRAIFFCTIFLFSIHTSANAQLYKGRDGAETYNLTGTYILNRYSSLSGSVNAGAFSFSVSNITELSGSYSFTNSVNPYAVNALRSGDLVMIIQVQGADITTTDNSSYGNITSYNGTGNYEVRTVFSVSGNTIYTCQALSNSYTQSGRSRIQVVRIPRLSSLTVGSLATVTGAAWSGSTGGVVALEVNGNVSVNGTITASSIGFRGGVDDKSVSSSAGAAAVTLYRSTSSSQSGSKGESIAGNATDYNSSLNGNYGRGAPANGGGGGNGHNAGGGGGSNAGTNNSLSPWNGTGIKSTTTANWANAWNLESTNFATNTSRGGGRGGYTYSNSNQDALTLAPGSNAWGGDYRQNVGGFGGRPLNYLGNKLFMGGGGGAGEGNNNSSGDGGIGGGIVYMLVTGNISGSGTIRANGQDGFNTQNTLIDAAGGAGGGGAIMAMASGTITGITMQANGGKGGDQLLLTGEAEGPGGGGGGGYIATTTTSITRQVSGGANGVSYSTMVTEFLPNGATMGADGTATSAIFFDVPGCDINGYVLSVKLSDFTATLKEEKVALQWATASEENSNHFEIERSFDGNNFSTIAIVFSKGNSSSVTNYSYNDNISGTVSPVIHYRLKIVATDNQVTYSDARMIRKQSQYASLKGINTYPNPVLSNDLNVILPDKWQNKKVRFEIYDINGKMVVAVEKMNAGQTELVSMTNASAGIYILHAVMGNESVQQRIVKR